MKYSDFTKIEQKFKQASSGDEFSSKICQTSYDTYYKIYKNSKYMWQYIKIIESEDTLIMDGTNKSIKEIENELKNNYTKFNYNNVLLILKNKTYDNIELLSKYDGIYILYDKEYVLSFCNLEEFTKMRKSIDSYKNLINSKNLSKLEEITFVYDITKSFKYDDSSDDKCIPRAIHSAINSKKFVCSGYVQFMNQILSELGHTCYYAIINDDSIEEHMVSIIKILDDKYNINGYFVFDPTADSLKKICLCSTSDGKHLIKYGSDNNYEVIRYFDDMCLYREFMIPIEEYRSFSDNNTSLFTVKDSDGKDVTRTFTKKLNCFRNYFGNDLNTFFKLMYNVKQAEGYSKEDTIKIMCDLVLINDVYPCDIASINLALSQIDKDYYVIKKSLTKKKRHK